MTRKSKLEPARQSKKKLGRVIDVTDDESFNWLHSGRTPEQKKKDEEEIKRGEEALRRMGYKNTVYAERTEETIELSQASAAKQGALNRLRK